MSNVDNLKLGDYNAICDVCGFKFKASQLRKRWDNVMVCKDDWEQRHSMDFFKGRPDDPSVPWSRPDSNADTDTTSIDGSDIQSDQTPEVYGDETGVYIYGPLVSTIIIYDTELVTADRTIAVFTGTAQKGNRVEISRTAGGPWALHIFAADGGSIKSIPANVNATATIEYDGTIWKLVNYTTLGL